MTHQVPAPTPARTGLRALRIGFVLLVVVSLSAASFALRILSAPAAVIPPDTSDNRQIEFLALGDQGSGSLRQWRVARGMEAVAERDRRVNFAIALGDNFYSSGIDSLDDRQWRYKFENVYRGRYLSALPFYAVLGNHDYQGRPDLEIEYSRRRLGSARWRMPDHYHVEDYGQAGGRPLLRLVYLDSNLTGTALATQTAFLQRALSAADGPRPVWQALASHHPLRSFGRHARLADGAGNPVPDAAEKAGEEAEDEEGNAEAFADQTLAVATAAKVDLVLSGHDHDQQVIAHPGEPAQVVTGGGGKPPYAVRHRGPDLKYSASENGFVKIAVDPDTLEIDMMNRDGAVRARFREERSCIPDLQVCLRGPG